jgi:hypothetical protein
MRTYERRQRIGTLCGIGGNAGVYAVEGDAARKGGGSAKGLTPQVACKG